MRICDTPGLCWRISISTKCTVCPVCCLEIEIGFNICSPPQPITYTGYIPPYVPPSSLMMCSKVDPSLLEEPDETMVVSSMNHFVPLPYYSMNSKGCRGTASFIFCVGVINFHVFEEVDFVHECEIVCQIRYGCSTHENTRWLLINYTSKLYF